MSDRHQQLEKLCFLAEMANLWVKKFFGGFYPFLTKSDSFGKLENKLGS